MAKGDFDESVSLRAFTGTASNNSTINIIFSTHGPRIGSVSGGATRELELMKRISNDLNVTLWVVSSQAICSKFQNNRVKAYYRSDPFFLKSENSDGELFFDSMLRSLFVSVSPIPLKDNGALVYSPSDFLWDTFPAFVWKLRSKHLKWVQVVHHLYYNPLRRKGEKFLTNLLGFLSQRMSLFLIRRKADAVIVVSPSVRQCLRELGFDSRKVRVICNGIDKTKIEHFEPSSKQLKKYDCVFLGRLNASKGLFDLIEIWRVLLKHAPNASLAIIGGGSKRMKQELENRVRQYNLQENISILGYLEDKEAFGILKSSRVFVFPSYEEGFGIAILEAMACGLPVVAWDLLVYKAVFQGGMITVPLKNTQKFAEVVLELLGNEQLRRNLSLAATKTSGKYDWNKVAEKELDLIKYLVKEK